TCTAWLSGTANATRTAWLSSGAAGLPGLTAGRSPIFIGSLLVCIRCAPAMLRIVLPLVALASGSPVNVPVNILVVVLVEIIGVEVDVAMVPIAIAPIAPVAAPSPPGGCTYRNSRAPRQCRPWLVPGIGIVGIRIVGRSSSVNDRWVVGWDVSYVGTGLLNLDHLFTAFDGLTLHFLLRAGF